MYLNVYKQITNGYILGATKSCFWCSYL